MSEIKEIADQDPPGFFATLSAATLTFCMIAAPFLIVWCSLGPRPRVQEIIVVSAFVLICMGLTFFFVGGLTASLFWIIFKDSIGLSLKNAAMVGGFTGFTISAVVMLGTQGEFIGRDSVRATYGLIVVFMTTCLGVLTWWNGYRVVLNRRRRQRGEMQ